MYTYLIVDDEMIERKGIRMLLSRMNIRENILEASNGEEALEVFEKEKIDVLLTDINMPFMDGIELLSRVHEEYPGTETVIFSGYDEFSYAKKAISYGVSAYILKPVNPEEFEKVVGEITEKLAKSEREEKRKDESMEFLREHLLYLMVNGQSRSAMQEKAQMLLDMSFANTFGMGNLPEYGIPNIMTADGPAGLRIQPQCGVNTTAWPCATLLACTWDPELIEEIGKAGGEEVKENNIGIWLTPAVNIHRSPLCGRNFEYYSEDPLVAGKSGAAMVRGMQSEHIGASVKHFCCNNKETNRKDSDSRVSERALREIYLKAFEIIVKEADPYTIMSSYNLINGVQASENKDLLTGILRGEWGFKGMVTTDWWTHGEHYRETKAGNDIKMANGYEERVQEAFDKGYITREEIALCAKRILHMILRMD